MAVELPISVPRPVRPVSFSALVLPGTACAGPASEAEPDASRRMAITVENLPMLPPTDALAAARACHAPS